MKRIETIAGQLAYIIRHKQAEEALQASETNFRTFLDHSSLGVRIRNTVDGITYANQAFLDIFGYQNIEESRLHPPQEFYAQAEYADYLERKQKIERGRRLLANWKSISCVKTARSVTSRFSAISSTETVGLKLILFTTILPT